MAGQLSWLNLSVARASGPRVVVLGLLDAMAPAALMAMTGSSRGRAGCGQGDGRRCNSGELAGRGSVPSGDHARAQPNICHAVDNRGAHFFGQTDIHDGAGS